MRKTCLPATTVHHKRAGLIGDYQVQSLDAELNASYGESFNLQAMSASNGRLMGMLGRGDYVGQSGLVGVSSALLLWFWYHRCSAMCHRRDRVHGFWFTMLSVNNLQASEKQPAGVYIIHDSQFLVLERRLFDIVLKQHPSEHPPLAAPIAH